MNKIRIITDSASDLLPNNPEGVTVLPMSVRFGDVEYLDGVTITHREFYEKLIESDELPATSLIAPGIFTEAYEEVVRDGDTAIVITVSGKLSGTYQSAMLAAEDYIGKIYVIDSRNVAIGEQILVRRALQLMEQELEAEAIAMILEKEKEKIHTIALLDTLEYLKKGGRISKTAAVVGELLSVKPVVAIEEGAIAMLGKARGSRSGNNFLIKEIQNTAGVDFAKPLCLGYTGLSDHLLQKYIRDSQALWDGHEESLRICSIGATIGTHAGPDAIAVSFFAK